MKGLSGLEGSAMINVTEVLEKMNPNQKINYDRYIN